MAAWIGKSHSCKSCCPISDICKFYNSFFNTISRLAPLFQLVLLSVGNRDVDPFFGHVSYPYFPSTNRLVYNNTISERREQLACWSTSTNLMAPRNSLLPLKK